MATILEQRIANAASGKSKLSFDPIGINENIILSIRIDDIDADDAQPRKDFGDLEGLKASIKEHGVVSPIILSTGADNCYRIIAGERRYRATRELGLGSIPAIVRTVGEQNHLELQIIENLHRKDFTPFEEARSYKRLMDEFNLSQKEVAQRIGKSNSSINEILRLLNFSDEEIKIIGSNTSISKSVLLEIARNDAPHNRLSLLNRAKSGNLTVSDARDSKKIFQTRKSNPRRNSQKFLTSQGEVIIKMEKSCPNINDMKLALREALEQLGDREHV